MRVQRYWLQARCCWC